MLTLQAYGSSIGKKIIMGVTGVILVLFIFGHLAGNLLIFLGPDAINAYSKKLIASGPKKIIEVKLEGTEIAGLKKSCSDVEKNVAKIPKELLKTKT